MTTCRLIYRSTATAEVVSNATIRDIAEKAAVANREHGITGLLVLTGRTFVQVLEGPCTAVNALYARIIADKRHREVELVAFEQIDSACFDDWGMRLVDLYDLPKAAREFMALKYRHTDGRVVVPEGIHELFSFLLDARAICTATPMAGD